MNETLNFVKEARDFSFSRKIALPRKITAEVARHNIETAMILGEISGTERVLTMILELKKDYPDFTIEDVEAALHEHLHKGLTYVSESVGAKERFPLERILHAYGYLS